MRTKAFVPAVTAFWPSIHLARGEQTVRLEFRTVPDRVTYYRHTSRTDLVFQTDSDGKKNEWRSVIKTAWTCRLKDLSPGAPEDHAIELTLLTLRRNLSIPGITFDFDSEKPLDNDETLGPVFQEFLGKPIVVVLDVAGRVIQTRGAEPILRAALGKAGESGRVSPMLEEFVSGLLDAQTLEHALGAYVVAGAPSRAESGAEWSALFVDPIDSRAFRSTSVAVSPTATTSSRYTAIHRPRYFS